VEHEVLPGELDPGDVITLPDSREQLLVKQVRLGKGGFILTVSPAGRDAPGAERLITLTAATRLWKCA
jgi:hypothetical protein